jgi:hypothetical protein
MRHLKKASPAMIVACLSLSIALSGVTYAATGGNFILGQSNSATTQSSLSSNVASAPTLNLVNTGGRPAARFQANGGTAVFTVSNSTKIPNLNADLLDGLDSGNFVQGAAGRSLYTRRTLAAEGGEVTLLTFPGFFDLVAQCTSGRAEIRLRNTSSAEIDYGWEGSPALYIAGTEPNVRYVLFDANSVGTAKIINLGQSYRLVGGGFPRTRMVTLSIGARGTSEFRPSCLVQAQAFAQG